MLALSRNERIAFPPFQLDLAAERLWCGPQVVGLPPKAFAVLRHLVARPQQLVTKDELLDAVWPDVHVNPEVLKVTIAEIRKALSDPFQQPKYIETAHRRGYRFIAPVKPVSPAVPGRSICFPVAGEIVQEQIPETRYTRSGDVNIAYQVLGDGPLDLVFVMGWVSHLEYFWTEPSFARFLRRLASFSRLILFDKRGTGLSDRVPLDALPTLEQRMDDVRAVMDAAGSKRAALCGVSEGATLAALFAATYPEKTTGLVMIGGYAKRIRDAGYPWGPTESERERFLEEIREQWGGPVGIEERAPTMALDPRFRQWWAAYLRMSASPAAAVALTRMNSQMDVRNILPSIRVPALVLHRTGDRCLRVEEGRYLASRIPGSRFVELPGDDHLPFVGDQDAILDEVEEFLTGARHTLGSERALATVLAATFHPVQGRARPPQECWNRLADEVRREFDRVKGRSFGEDSLLASFDGPAKAIHCATAIAHHASRLGVVMKAGLHIGECALGPGRIEGLAVDLAREIERQSRPGEILVSATIRDLVAGSGIRFEKRGCVTVAGAPEGLPLLAVERARLH